MPSPSATFTLVNNQEPHRGRTRQILKAHPEVRRLITKAPVTFAVMVACVGAQVLLAYFVSGLAWYWILLAAYFVGAFFSHTLFVTIHEAAHNLIFRKTWQNTAAGIFANFPTVVPTAISFKNFHLQHHVHQGVHELDADLPDWYEAKLIRNYSVGK
ncbi:MAG TPA: fatty acid desaturase, partial [Hymenobacter sp.]